jgi:hypothetical protein
MEEEYQLSESDDSDSFRPYECDPIFDTKQDRDKFVKSCDIKPAESDDDNLDYSSNTKKICSCGKCDDIWSGTYEHKCCKQYTKWKRHAGQEEEEKCIVDIEAFRLATNHYALRNLLLILDQKNKSQMKDPPANNQMRFAFYKAAILLIGG